MIELLYLWGYQVHHETDSRKSTPGLPDIIAVRPPRLFCIELKTEQGRLRNEQKWWKADLERVPGITYLLLRPSGWNKFLEVLL